MLTDTKPPVINKRKHSKPSKCKVCKKRSLTNYKCKCKKTICLSHRAPESHKCTFDWESYSRDLLVKKVVGSEPLKLNTM